MEDWRKAAARLGKRVRELRQLLEISQEELAWQSNLHRTYVSAIEGGRRNPSLGSLVKLATGLECEIADLFPRKS